jgi:hypothetical protein
VGVSSPGPGVVREGEAMVEMERAAGDALLADP